MNKTEIVKHIADATELSQVAATKAFNAVLDAIKNALQAEDAVTIVGFGTFAISKRAARKGRNPQTGKEIDIAARKVVKFTAGKDLKDAVN